MERICGECRYFRVSEERDTDSVGRCRLDKVMGVFRSTMRACPSFSRAGDPDPPIVTGSRRNNPRRARSVGEPFTGPRIAPATLADALAALDAEELHRVLEAWAHDHALLGDRDITRAWSGGVLMLCPADQNLKVKDMPLEQFLHKLVMIRDNLRVLEQKVNSHKHLHDGERVDLQRRISLCHVAVGHAGAGWIQPQLTDDDFGRAMGALYILEREALFNSLMLPIPPIGERWVGGRARFTREGDEIDEPMEDFYIRIVVLRDRLRTLEAQVSAHPHIAPDEADGIGGYIRRCYGSLTSFNLLFRERSDYFSSSR